MEIIDEPLPGILVIKAKVFADDRGHFFESFRKDLFESKKIQPSMTSKEFKELSSKLPRRNAHFDRTKEREKKATEVSFTIKVKIPVQNFKVTQNRIIKEIKNYYFD